MVRRSNLPEKKATLQPEKAIPILETLVSEASGLFDLNEDDAAITEWKQTAEGILGAAFGEPNPNLQAFGREQCGAYSPYDTPEYRKSQFHRQLNGMIGGWAILGSRGPFASCLRCRS